MALVTVQIWLDSIKYFYVKIAKENENFCRSVPSAEADGPTCMVKLVTSAEADARPGRVNPHYIITSGSARRCPGNKRMKSHPP